MTFTIDDFVVLTECVAQTAKVDVGKLQLDTKLESDLNFDSLDYAELIRLIEERYDESIVGDELLFSFTESLTIAELVHLCNAHPLFHKTTPETTTCLSITRHDDVLTMSFKAGESEWTDVGSKQATALTASVISSKLSILRSEQFRTDAIDFGFQSFFRNFPELLLSNGFTKIYFNPHLATEVGLRPDVVLLSDREVSIITFLPVVHGTGHSDSLMFESAAEAKIAINELSANLASALFKDGPRLGISADVNNVQFQFILRDETLFQYCQQFNPEDFNFYTMTYTFEVFLNDLSTNI